MRHPLRAATILVAAAAVVTTMLAPEPAAAINIDPPPTTIPLPVVNISEPIKVEYIQVDGDPSDAVVVLPAGTTTNQVATQCIEVPGIGRMCIGSPTEGEQPPITVTDGSELAPLVKWSAEARGALDWMIPEGAEFVSGAYNLPNDERILKYARPALRTYIVDQLLQSMDKELLGQPLSENERNALAFVRAQYRERDRILAKAAYDEYLRFKASPCTYRPPVAPKVVEKPETLPQKVIDWCKLPTTQTSNAFEFVPPLPSPKQFTAWASYRNAKKLGLTAFEDPVMLSNLVNVAAATATVGGFGIAGIGGSLAFQAALATGNAAKIASKLLPHAGKVSFEAGKGIARAGSEVANAASAAGSLSGALAAAVIAVAVIVFLVVTGVSIYLLVQHDSVAKTLRDRVDETKKDDYDPFGINDDLKEEYASKPIDYANPPSYRSAAVHAQLSAQVVRWTSEYHADAPAVLIGKTVPDPQGTWLTPAEVADSYTWLVSTAGATAVERTSVALPRRDGQFTRVRFNSGWAIVDPPDADANTTTSFGYVDQFGTAQIVTRDPSAPNRFIVTNSEGSVQRLSTLTFRNSNGQTVRARLKGSEATYLAGPRPVAVGPLLAGRPVLLRPNPVGLNGQSLDPALVQSDYSFDWAVQRLNPESGEWDVVHTEAAYGARFVPTQPGQYEARVTTTNLDNPSQQQFGTVQFEITSPPIAAPVLALEDNGSSRLELDLQFTEDVPSDVIDIEVTWPGDLGSEVNPVQQLSAECQQTGPVDCTTPRTGPANVLVLPVTPDTDLRRPVQIVATNRTGASFEAEFPIGAARPVAAPPPAGSNASEPGDVLVGRDSTQVTMPLEPSAGVQEYTVATLVPSAGGGQDFGLVNPATGNTTTSASVLLPGLFQGVAEVFQEQGTGPWYLGVRGVPEFRDIGSFEVPLVVSQTNGTRQLVLVVIHVVPSSKDRFRGAVQSNVDPNNVGVDVLPEMYPMVLGGRASDAAYTGEMCVSLRRVDFGAAAKTYCAPRSAFLTADGVAKRFPVARLFPSGLEAGGYRAEARLTTSGTRVDTSPLGTSFRLLTDVTYPRPKVALGAVGISGTPIVGRTLRASVSSVDPATARLRYQWLRDGSRISGATARSYVVTRRDRGDRLSVRVTATFPEWTTGVRTSPRTAIVR